MRSVAASVRPGSVGGAAHRSAGEDRVVVRTVGWSWTGDAVLLDLDGVMVDSQLAIARAWRQWAADRDVPWSRVEPLLPGRHAEETIAELAPAAPPASVADEARAVIDAQVDDTGGLKPVPGMVAFVRALPAGRWATVTACPGRLAEARLRATGFPWPVPVLVAAEDVTRGKPDPEGYVLAARRLGVSPSACLVVEDSPIGIDSAKAAGMAALALRTTHAVSALTAADAVVRDGTEIAVETRS